MGKRSFISVIALLCWIFMSPAAFAELYGWVDENGVKHFSNYPPPEGVKSFRHTKEIKSKEPSTNVQMDSGTQKQPPAAAPSAKSEPAESGQVEGASETERVISDDDRIRREKTGSKLKPKHEFREKRGEGLGTSEQLQKAVEGSASGQVNQNEQLQKAVEDRQRGHVDQNEQLKKAVEEQQQGN